MTAIPLTIPSLRSAYAAGVTASDVVDQVFTRIEEVGDPNIFLCLFDKADVLAAADGLGAYDPEKPLWGVPFAIKDNIDAAGYPTTAACPAFAYDAVEDAFVVKQLKAAGALLIGKTNLDQFATGLVGVRTPYGAPLNSIDPDIVPGGSSGGSGVAVGHGIVTFALGTDTAGSGRVPAALNNIVGLKPTLGSLSTSGLVPACRTLDTISVFALTVEDAYAAFQCAAGYDVADSFSKSVPTPPLTAWPGAAVLGIPDAGSINFFGDTVQAQSFSDTVETLRASGATIREIDFKPFYSVAEMLYYGAWVAERYAVIEELLTRDPEAVFPATREIIGKGSTLSAADAFRGIYRLRDLIREAEPLLAQVDMLCVPTIPTFYSVADLEADPITPNNNFGTYTNFVNLMDMCGIAVPAPGRRDGRPGGVTFLAPAGEDAKVAAMATVVEAAGTRTLGATGWEFVAPDLPPPDVGADRIEIAVCGAHLSGLPLNGELTSRGGTLIRAGRTTSDYAFYALPSAGVAKPGLVRVADGSGVQVSVEVWSLPLEQFGSFMKTIAAPLGIGMLRLSDGSNVHGFLCEAVATEGAREISDLADWRVFVARS